MTEIWSLGSREDGDFVIIRNLGHKRSDTFGVREMLTEGTRRQGGDVQRTRNAGLETWGEEPIWEPGATGGDS